MLTTVEFWSAIQAETQIGSGAATKSLPSVTLPDITIGTLKAVFIMMKYTCARNAGSGAASYVSGAQNIQVKESVAGSWTTGMVMPDKAMYMQLLDEAAEDWRNNITPGQTLIGPTDVKAEVAAMNKTYSMQWLSAKAFQDYLQLQDVQMGLRLLIDETVTVGSVAEVGKVTGNVEGNVLGTVASVVGNLGGKVVGNVDGSVGSVIGNVGGNVNGSVASVVGNLGGKVVGNVDGSVGSVVGNVGGKVVGNVDGSLGGDVLGDVKGDVDGGVGSVVGNVGGNLVGDVQGDVDGDVKGNVDGNVNGHVHSQPVYP